MTFLAMPIHWMAAWLSASAMISINELTLHWGRLVLSTGT